MNSKKNLNGSPLFFFKWLVKNIILLLYHISNNKIENFIY